MELRAFGFSLGAKLISIARALMLVAKCTRRNTLAFSATDATVLKTSVLKPCLYTPSSASTPAIYIQAFSSSLICPIPIFKINLNEDNIRLDLLQ